MTTHRTVNEVVLPFSSALFNALVKTINQGTQSTWLASAMPDADVTSDEPVPIRIMLKLGSSIQGDCLLEIAREQALLLVSKILGRPIAKFGPKHADALIKVVRSAVDEIIQELEPECGSFTVHISQVTDPASDKMNAVQNIANDAESNRLSITMYFNPQLTDALSLRFGPKLSSVTNADSESVGSATAMKADPIQVNLKLVMDVELNVTLRFGQRQLTLREVLELASGSVVELDRQVEEPVELLLDGKVIARGEAVVIDGNYGLRVTEVPEPLAPLIRQ